MKVPLAAWGMKRQTASGPPGGSSLILQETPLVKVKPATGETRRGGRAGGRCDEGKPWTPDTQSGAGRHSKEPRVPLPVSLFSVLCILLLALWHLRNCDGEILEVPTVRLS